MALPALPHTGVYVQKSDDFPYSGVDQELCLCSNCGHGQLRNVLEAKIVYGSSYTHRTDLSPISRGSNLFLEGFIRKNTGVARFQSYLEPGCNDMFLMNRLQDLWNEAVGLDPVWKSFKPESLSEKITLVPGMLEDHLQDLPRKKYDLIASSHTLEHVPDPYQHLKVLREICSDDGYLFIEVPAMDTMVKALRFDQVFHQHIHYFSLYSLSQILNRAGWKIQDVQRNFNMWGGSLLVACRPYDGSTAEKLGWKLNQEYVGECKQAFTMHMEYLSQLLENLKGESIIGFGAGQMLPILAYHLGTDLGDLEVIYDDDSAKDGLGYPNLAPRIAKPADELDLSQLSILITAPDSAKAILRKILNRPHRRVIAPFSNLF